MRRIVMNLNEEDALGKISYALASPVRREILRLLCMGSRTVGEIADSVHLALSTSSFHLKVLNSAGLVKLVANPNKKGNEKNVSIECEYLGVQISSDPDTRMRRVTAEIPLGSFIQADITPPCCICTNESPILPFDNRNIFLNPDRIHAQLISFLKGSITYAIPIEQNEGGALFSLSIGMEICSECPNYNNSWKSDISFWINDVEIAVYHSLGDYGEPRGAFTPGWWPSTASQYGMPVSIKIDRFGVFLNGVQASSHSLESLKILENGIIFFKIGVKDDAVYVGGVNLFGRQFGNINKDITIQYEYTP